MQLVGAYPGSPFQQAGLSQKRWKSSTIQCTRCHKHAWSAAHTLAQVPRRAVQMHAKRRDEDYDYVTLDGEDEENSKGFNLVDFGQGVLRAVNGAADGLADFVYQFVPEGTSKAVVNTSVKAGLVLTSLALVKSLLSLVVTVGFVVLGLYVALRVFGIGVTDVGTDAPSTRRKGQSARRGRRSDRDDDVIDVWYETKDGNRRR